MLKVTTTILDQFFLQHQNKLRRYSKLKQRRIEPNEAINNYYLYLRKALNQGKFTSFESQAHLENTLISIFIVRLKHNIAPNIQDNGDITYKNITHFNVESSFGNEIGIEDISVKAQQLADTPESLLMAKQNAHILNEALFITNIDAPKGTKLTIDWANEELPGGSMYNHGIKSHYTNSKRRLAQLIKRDEIEFSVYEEDRYTLYGTHARGVGFTNKKPCSIPGCTRHFKAKNVCAYHYSLIYLKGKKINEQKSDTVSSNS